MNMEMVSGALGSTVASAIGGDLGKMLMDGGKGAQGAMNAAMKSSQAGIAGSNVPRAQKRPVSIEDILAVLQQGGQLGTGGK